MELNSILSIVAGTKNAKDRRIVIMNSWSDEEKEERRKTAVEMQVRLTSLISMAKHKTNRVGRVLELAS